SSPWRTCGSPCAFGSGDAPRHVRSPRHPSLLPTGPDARPRRAGSAYGSDGHPPHQAQANGHNTDPEKRPMATAAVTPNPVAPGTWLSHKETRWAGRDDLARGATPGGSRQSCSAKTTRGGARKAAVGMPGHGARRGTSSRNATCTITSPEQTIFKALLMEYCVLTSA